jgi:hypothetical protein
MNKLSELDIQHLHAAAEEVGDVLDSLQTIFSELLTNESYATEQNFLATNAFCYAKLAHMIGTLPQHEDVRAALSIVGMLSAVETYFQALAATVRPRLHICCKAAGRATDFSSPPAAAA